MDLPEIEILHWPEPIRRRPELYVGSLDDPAVANCLIIEALCDSFDQIVSGTCTEVSVEISSAQATIVNNGLGVSMRLGTDGKPLAETMMTQLFACRHMKANEVVGKDFCRNGIAVVNALSLYCAIENRTNGQHWQQRYTRGLPDSPFKSLGTTTETGFTIQFMPDPELIKSPAYDIPAFLAWLTGVRFTSGQAALRIHHQDSGEPAVARLYDGVFKVEGTG